jgi:hypothetical protein
MLVAEQLDASDGVEVVSQKRALSQPLVRMMTHDEVFDPRLPLDLKAGGVDEEIARFVGLARDERRV